MTTPRQPAVVLLSSAAITMPGPSERGGKRGSDAQYPFEKLEVGKSIAVINRTKKQLQTTVAGKNAFDWPVLDAAGKPVMEDIKGPGEGGKTVTVGKKPKTEKRFFFAVDCDSATDPEGATARIWREK